ncbi:MAG: cation transporter [Spirochaetaceae bacterium]|jgi:Cd2+/Zn2+-exporting ATPase|nr:cation transporter [Spirochaetaceae bacterium]
MTKKNYLLDGLCCPNCAAKIEAQTGRLAGVRNAAVDFSSKRLTLEVEDGTSDFLPDVAAIARIVDEDIIVKAG